MPTFTSSQIQAAITQLMTDIGLLHDIVQGDSSISVSTEGGPVPSIAKFYNQVLAAISVGSFPGVIVSNQATISGNYTAVSGDTGKTLNVTGGQWTITFGAASGYSDPFTAVVINRNLLAATFVAIDSFAESPVKLWPGESILMQRTGSNWAPIYNIAPKRFKRLGGINLYVGNGATGSDTANDGLSSSRPFLKIQKAVEVAQFECDGGVTINLQAGTHTPRGGDVDVVRVTGPAIGADLILVLGDTTGTGQTGFVLQCPTGGTCVNVQDNGILVINGCYCTTAVGGAATLVNARQQSVLDFNGCDLGNTVGGSHISAQVGASINIGNNAGNPVCMNVRGAAAVHLGVSSGAYCNYGSFTVAIPSALSMGFWFTAAQCGVISNGGAPMTYSGAGLAGTTGTRFSIDTNAVCISSATEPGNTAGTTTNGGFHA
jgi:hypothetical protein